MLDPSLKHFQDDTTLEAESSKNSSFSNYESFLICAIDEFVDIHKLNSETIYDTQIYLGTTDSILQEMGV